MKLNRQSFLYRNSLSIVFILLLLMTIIGQFYTGWHEYNKILKEYHSPEIGLWSYLHSGHCIETTFENWESEFLQMWLYVLLTVFLRQKGSSESKSIDKAEEVDREPKPGKNAPWPVNKGGIWLRLYKSSLSISFLFLFLISFILHAYGSLKNYNEEQILKGEQTQTIIEYLTGSKLWFESLQNWQSEFLSVASIVILSIFLRQKGSPESKPIDAPYYETGS